ncbi:MAG TPA: hypothetical protein VEX70_15945 [Pyrinomonadaceae bacterium]|nr:hypothetical protein [Pyrinomonadaceae bacterium]
MLRQIFKSAFFQTLRGASLFVALSLNYTATAQPQKPLTSQELVRLVYQLPAQPQKRDEIVEEIRQRGIDFELTTGLRGIVATKSGNDALLRRTLEEAARRRANPAGYAPPSADEAALVLANARTRSLEASKGLPDFVVKQLVTRSEARGKTQNWQVRDRLTVGVSYRESAGGEQYKLLATNGLPNASSGAERGSYEQAGGSTTTGEFASLLIRIFSDEAATSFNAVATDTLRGRRTIIYDFDIKKDAANNRLLYGGDGETRITTTGLRGRIWVDREQFRVLRAEYTTSDVEPDFPIRQLDKAIDFNWVTISEKQYLLPVAANATFTTAVPVTYVERGGRGKFTQTEIIQTRNEIRFRNYQRFGSEVKIIEDGDFTEEETPPAKKP